MIPMTPQLQAALERLAEVHPDIGCLSAAVGEVRAAYRAAPQVEGKWRPWQDIGGEWWVAHTDTIDLIDCADKEQAQARASALNAADAALEGE